MVGRAKKTKSDRRSSCPLSCSLDIMGDKWTLLIVRDLFVGKTAFKDFLDSPEGIATNVLSERLIRLLDNGLIEKYHPTETGRREHYRLTKRGQGLMAIVKPMVKWGSAELPRTRLTGPYRKLQKAK